MQLTWKLGRFDISLLDILLFVFGLIFLFARLIYPGLAQFVSDEPQLAMMWDDIRAQGKVTFVGLSGSNLATPYGALASWLYGGVKLFSHHPGYFAFLQSSLSVFSILLVVFAVRKYSTGNIWLYFLSAIALSPYIFFYNRHPWDNTFIIPFTGFLIVGYLKLAEALSHRNRKGIIWSSIFTGVVCGLLLNIHLMAGILILGMVLALIFHRQQTKGSWSSLGLALSIGVATCFIVILPYAIQAIEVAKTLPTPPSKGDRTMIGDGRQIWWSFVKSNVHLSTFGVRVFWGDLGWQHYSSYVGDFFTFLYRKDIQGWPVKIAAFLFIFFATFRLFKRSDTFHFYPLDFLMIGSFFMIVIAFWILNIPVQPHYYHVIWWVGGYAFARAIGTVKVFYIKRFLQVFFVLTLFANGSYIFNTMNFVHANDGYRGINFGPSIYEQWDAATRLCEMMDKLPNSDQYVVDIGQLHMLRHPLLHNMRHKEECRRYASRVRFVRNFTDGVDIRARHPEFPVTSAKIEFELEQK